MEALATSNSACTGHWGCQDQPLSCPPWEFSQSSNKIWNFVCLFIMIIALTCKNMSFPSAVVQKIIEFKHAQKTNFFLSYILACKYTYTVGTYSRLPGCFNENTSFFLLRKMFFEFSRHFSRVSWSMTFFVYYIIQFYVLFLFLIHVWMQGPVSPPTVYSIFSFLHIVTFIYRRCTSIYIQ